MSSCSRAMDSLGGLKRSGVALKEADGSVMTRDGQVMTGDGDSRASLVWLQALGHDLKRPCTATSMAGRRGKLCDNGIAVCGGRMKVSGRCGMKGVERWG